MRIQWISLGCGFSDWWMSKKALVWWDFKIEMWEISTDETSCPKFPNVSYDCDRSRICSTIDKKRMERVHNRNVQSLQFIKKKQTKWCARENILCRRRFGRFLGRWIFVTNRIEIAMFKSFRSQNSLVWVIDQHFLLTKKKALFQKCDSPCPLLTSNKS
jgi:hypothetical protein